MPPQEQAFREQKALLWAFAGVDRYNKVLRADPVEIKVRWVNKSATRAELSIAATVIVDRAIDLQSLMWLGEEADWYGTGSGYDDSAVMMVVIYDETPDINHREVYREVALQRFHGALPQRALVGEAAISNLLIGGTGAGFTNGVCEECTELNAATVAALVINDLELQEWRGEYLELFAGTGTGSCEQEWQWHVTRDLLNNRVTVELALFGLGVVAGWQKSNTVWDGIEPLVLALQSGSHASCGWPATLSIQGVTYVPPTGSLLLTGSRFRVGTCVGCTTLNANFTLLAVASGSSANLWRSAEFTFDGVPYRWEVWRNAIGDHSGLLLKRVSDGVLLAAWVFESTWDGVDEVRFGFSAAADDGCCVWPRQLTVKGI